MSEERSEHAPVLGPLRRVGAGHYESRDGQWVLGRMESVGAWFVWADGDEYPVTSDRFATLRDAKSYVTDLLGTQRSELRS